MAKIFHKGKKTGRSHPQSRPNNEKVELIDPILYIGGLDKDKYPQLPLENEKKIEEEIENPLNKR